MSDRVDIHWFRRDLRIKDNRSLHSAVNSENPTLFVFIFDTEILDELDRDDARVSFIHDQLSSIHKELVKLNSAVVVRHGPVKAVWSELLKTYEIGTVHCNEDYEPYARDRDKEVEDLLEKGGAQLKYHTDQVIFRPGEILKNDGLPYTVYTPYSKKWLAALTSESYAKITVDLKKAPLYDFSSSPVLPTLDELGFERSTIVVKKAELSPTHLSDYDKRRNDPAQDGGSYLSPHLRFGTISVREVLRQTIGVNETFVKEIIWREFFMQILHHFPHVIGNSFRAKYDRIPWRNNHAEFEKWCQGETGYPFVDAGMRELNTTGYMHNRVRMVVASFLCKHLLIDWRWGEAYFAKKLLDFELSSNNGNWQWAAGTGCDAAPYFRVFNPTTQYEKFDPQFIYIKKWVPELGTADYAEPMVEHKMARLRAIETYKTAINEV